MYLFILHIVLLSIKDKKKIEQFYLFFVFICFALYIHFNQALWSLLHSIL